MRPMLKQPPILLDQLPQMLAVEGLVARKDDLLMGADDSRNAVHLHEAEIVDELIEPLAVERAAGMGGEALTGEEDAAGSGVGDVSRHEELRHMFLICSSALSQRCEETYSC